MKADADISAKTAPGARDALLLIAAFLLLRLAVSWLYPAMIDEAYAIVVSREWSLSYFDHPPAGFTLARLMAWLAGTENIFIVRLPFVLAGSLSAWLVWDITRIAFGARAAWWALAWYSVAPFFLISSGHFVVPDGPLNLALLATLRLVLPDLLAPERPPRIGRWFAAGLCFALAFASKYHAVLFGAAAGLFLLTGAAHRRMLATAAPWIAVSVGILGLAPVVVWNASHDWVSLGFQAARAGSDSPGINPGNFARTLAGQMAYLLPGTWLVVMAMAAKGVWRPGTIADRLFGWLAILPPVFFLAAALISRNSLPHWAMSGLLFGFPLAGAWTARHLARHRRGILLAWRASWIGIPVLALCVGLQARHAFFTRVFDDASPRLDLDWQMQDWSVLAAAWPELGAPAVVVTSDWHIGGKAGHALGPNVTILPFSDPRHFRFIGSDRVGPAVAIHPARIGGTDAAMTRFLGRLDGAGYDATGNPVVLRSTAGRQPRFEIIAVPVEKAP